MVAGCAQPAASTSTVSGTTLSVYASAPPPGLDDSRAQDVLAGERLAFRQGGGRVSGFKLRLVVLHGAKISDNARTAIEDKTTIGYVGEIIPGESADSLGIVGDLGIVQVSPTDNAVELTQHSGAVAGSPDIYYEASRSSQQTFARVVPTTALEARALLSELQALHVARLYLTDDGHAYGAALASAVRQAAGASVSVVQGRPTASAVAASGADAVLYATADKRAAAALFDAVAAANRAPRLLGASALADQGFATGLSPAAQQRLEVSSPGFLPASLPAAGRGFVTAFSAAYGHQPSPEALFGYEAMAALLSALERAGRSAASRSTVLHDFFATRNRTSVLGTYSIDATGDINLAPFVISRVVSGRLVPYRFVSEQG